MDRSMIAIIAGIVIIAFALALWAGIKQGEIDTQEFRTIQGYGYDLQDVQVFLRIIGASTTQFCRSGGLRKQYEAYRDGVPTDFYQSAKSHRESQDSQDQAVMSATNAAIITSTVMNATMNASR